MTTGKKKRSDAESFQLAGMSNYAGKLSSLIQARQIGAPVGLELRGNRLVWKDETYLQSDSVYNPLVKSRRQNPELLFEFTKLADASPARILEFAGRWGVLGICKHGMPYTHAAPPTIELPDKYWCTPRQNIKEEYWEPVSSWHYYSRLALAMLRIAANLHQNKPGEVRDWNIIFNLGENGDGDDHGRSLEYDKSILTALVNLWLELGNVRPKLRWRENTAAVAFDAHLFGALASQLMVLVSRTKGLGICSSCGEPYVPGERGPKTTQNNYCKGCGKRASSRDAQRARRRRLRGV